jgi:DNA repair ATPase RecN
MGRMQQLTAQRQAAAQVLQQQRQSLTELAAAAQAAAEAYALVKGVATEMQTLVHLRIGIVVSRALAAVFPKPFGFGITFVERRNRTEADVQFTKDGQVVGPEDCVEGGQLDVAAFALRVAAVVLHQPKRRRVLLLDEPFGGVAGVNRQRLAALLTSIATELGVQFLVITHTEEFRVGVVRAVGSEQPLE